MRKAVLMLSIALGAALPASAQNIRSSPLPNHLPVGAEACYGRVYDAAHLRAHPQQRVTSFFLHRDFTPDTASEEPPKSRGDTIRDDGSDGNISLTALLRLRDKKGVFSNHFGCRRDNGVVRCGIDCDGGSFLAKPAGAALSIENQGFVVIGGCDASDQENENPVVVKPGLDDRTFRLDKAPLAQCTALRDEQKPAWARLGAPLRERFAKDGALCLTRSYDAAHLASHPQQTVKRIAVLKIATAGEPHHPPQYNLVFRVELKNGRRLEGKTNCWPENYTYTCTHAAELDTQRSFYLTRASDDAVMLRDRKGSLGALFKDKLGADDRLFRLAASPQSACEF